MMKPWQLRPETNLQKALSGGGDPSEGKPLDAIVVIDDSIRKGEPGHEFIVYANRGELRGALLDAEQRGDVRIRPEDASLIDSGRIRRSVAEALYPGQSFGRADDLRKSGADAELMGDLDADGNRIVARAEAAYNSDIKKAARDLDRLVTRQNG